jgi:bifunctional non-homologous end joining protein LigD
MQEYIRPMLPADLSRSFDNSEWLFEKNHGGFRAITVKTDGNVRLHAHKHQLFNEEFPHLVKELENIPSDIVIDGEIVLNQQFRDYPKFNHKTATYFVFDLLSLKGKSLLKTPLIQRKLMLQKIIPGYSNSIVLKNYVVENGCELFRKATQENLEGITAKKTDGSYYPGKVSSDWLKIRIKSTQEVYICGFTKPNVHNRRIGSIIAGFKENNCFSYSGHIAAGFDNYYIQNLYTQLIPLVTEKSPFNCEIKSNKDIVWVHPVIKCEVKYLELTKDHLMRQPVLLALSNAEGFKT